MQSDWSAESGDAAILHKPSIPAATSDLVNDSGYISAETDPTVPVWAKQANKPAYTASEVGALPDDTAIPTKTSELTNDSGYITGVPDMTGATGADAGTHGLVPAPAAGDQGKYLRGDGTWQTAGSGGGLTFDDIYPVGSIYMSVNAADPGTLFGGTWTRIQDCFLLAAGSTYSAGTTGGEAEHTLDVTEIPAHEHRMQVAHPSNTGSYTTNYLNYGRPTGTTYTNTSAMTNVITRGGTNDAVTVGQPFSILPPYLAVYVWQRTA